MKNGTGILIGCILLINNVVIAQNKVANFYVGTYTDSGSEGIYRFGIDLSNGKLQSNGLAAMSESPSFLALHPNGKFLLSVREITDSNNNKTGYIELFSRNEAGKLVSVNKMPSEGAHPCYVSVNQEGYVLAANYSSGNLSLLKINPSGELSSVLSSAQHSGSGPNINRQEKPHVHSARFEPSGKRIFVADLGIDQVKVYQIDPKSSQLKPFKFPEIKLPPGSGPRHLDFYPEKGLLYVSNELTSSVSVIRLLENGSFKILETISALPDTYDKPNTCADIHLSTDRKFLYVSNRGLNSIAIFSVDSEKGTLKLIGQESVRGETPRNFTLSPDGDYLLVANQNSDTIVSFRRDQATGKLTFADQINAFKPVCLLFE